MTSRHETILDKLEQVSKEGPDSNLKQVAHLSLRIHNLRHPELETLARDCCQAAFMTVTSENHSHENAQRRVWQLQYKLDEIAAFATRFAARKAWFAEYDIRKYRGFMHDFISGDSFCNEPLITTFNHDDMKPTTSSGSQNKENPTDKPQPDPPQGSATTFNHCVITAVYLAPSPNHTITDNRTTTYNGDNNITNNNSPSYSRI